jgi:hypothetical protein
MVSVRFPDLLSHTIFLYEYNREHNDEFLKGPEERQGDFRRLKYSAKLKAQVMLKKHQLFDASYHLIHIKTGEI